MLVHHCTTFFTDKRGRKYDGKPIWCMDNKEDPTPVHVDGKTIDKNFFVAEHNAKRQLAFSTVDWIDKRQTLQTMKWNQSLCFVTHVALPKGVPIKAHRGMTTGPKCHLATNCRIRASRLIRTEFNSFTTRSTILVGVVLR